MKPPTNTANTPTPMQPPAPKRAKLSTTGTIQNEEKPVVREPAAGNSDEILHTKPSKRVTSRNKNRPKKRGKASKAQRNRFVKEKQNNQSFETGELSVSKSLSSNLAEAISTLKSDIEIRDSNLESTECSTSFPQEAQDSLLESTVTSEHSPLPSTECSTSFPQEAQDSLLESTVTSEHSPLPSTECSTSFPQEVQDSLPELIVECEDSTLPLPFPSGRVICDIGFVIAQARKLEEHNHVCCFNGKLVYSKTITRGLVHDYTFVCDKVLCGYKETLVTDRKQGCLNQLAVLGAMSVGNGLSQEEQKFSIMNMTYMSPATYASCEKSAGKVIEANAKEGMNAAINEEKKLASERSDVDVDGFHNICVIVDGGWCKRSYGHGYNASSGVAVIIGAVTQKILFISNRNKVCLICQAIEDKRIPPNTHTCSKNWVGPSTAMEADIIVEGIKYLEEVHHIRCTRLIGDGDTNLMKKVQENVSFGGWVMKVECANHAVRRYLRALERIQKNTSKFKGTNGVKARKVLLQCMGRLVIGAREAIKRNALPNLQQPNQEKVDKLAAEILNGPAHVFGKHEACSDFCKRKELDKDSSAYHIMRETGMLSAIMDEIRRTLVSCCNTLIFNVTNNPAEHYMSQFCKTIGGKRIDFAKGGSIKRRANIAAVAYQNPGQKWQYEAHKQLTGRSPGTPHRKFIVRRLNRHIKRLNRKKLFTSLRKKKRNHVDRGGDENYGDQPDVPDLDPDSFRLKARAHMSSIVVKTRDELEQLTRGQASCERWRYERAKRIPSSLFKDVAGRRPTTLCANLVKRIIYRDTISTNAMEYGIANESVAVKQYEAIKGVEVKRCGLFVDPTCPFLCTSPDGLIGEEGLLEVKCPFSAKNSQSLIEVVEKKCNIGLKIQNGELYLPSAHKYFYQIQGQLAITNRKWCDLFVWSPKDTKILRIQRDTDFWNKIVPKLRQFYTECCIPEIVDPRVPRKQPIREPQYILVAIKQKITKRNKVQSTTPLQPLSTVVQHSTTVIQPSTTIIQPSTTVIQPSTTVIQPSNTFVQSSTTVAQSSTTVAQPVESSEPKAKRIRKSKVIFDL